MACATSKEGMDLGADAVAKDLFRCTICFDSFRHPRMLPCLHSFCEECLSQHIASASSNSTPRRHTTFDIDRLCTGYQQHFKCPQCRELVPLPAKGVQGFRQDFRVSQVKDVMKKMLDKVHRDYCAFCEASGVHKTYTHYCMDCCKKLCSECVEKHNNIDVFRSHKFQTTDGSYLVCSNHPEEKAIYLCVTCAIQVCSICIMTDVSHEHHSIKQLDMGLQEYKLSLHEAQVKLQNKLPVISNVRLSVGKSKELLMESKQQVEHDIRDRVAAAQEMLQKSERDAFKSLTEKFNKASERHKHIQDDLDQLGKEVELLDELSSDVLDAPTSPKLLEVYKDIPARIDKLLLEFDLLSLQTSSSSCSLQFKPSSSKIRVGKIRAVPGPAADISDESPNESTGKNLDPTRAQVMYRFGSLGCRGGEFDCPRDLCILSDDTIVVADCNNERLQRFHMNGMLINTIGDGQIRPWGVTALQDGNIAVTDNLHKRVRLFTPQGESLKDIGHFLCPCGITQDNEGNLLVTDFFSTFVYTISTGGSPVAEFSFRSVTDPHTCGVSRLAVMPNNHIVVSDVCNRTIKMFTNEGLLIWKTSPVNCPQGIAVMDGRIYVADAVHMNVVQVDSTNGKHVDEILRPSMLDDPTGLSVSRSGYVTVTQLRCNMVLVLKL